jgi:YD repeat-containing protein
VLDAAELGGLVRELHGELPASLGERLVRAQAQLTLARADRLVGRDASGNIETGLETWTVTLSWTADGRRTTRTFTRVTAQG